MKTIEELEEEVSDRQKKYQTGYRLGRKNTPFSLIGRSKWIVAGWSAGQMFLYRMYE